MHISNTLSTIIRTVSIQHFKQKTAAFTIQNTDKKKRKKTSVKKKLKSREKLSNNFHNIPWRQKRGRDYMYKLRRAW